MAIIVDIPGRKTYCLSKLVMDLNGTLTLDGKLRKKTASLLRQVTEILPVYILTADTLGVAARATRELDVLLHVFSGSDVYTAKRDFIEQLGPEEVIAVGNGSNDAGMLEKAAIGIAVLGPEGCSVQSLRYADLQVKNVDDALMMILKPKRLVATLRL